MRLRRGMLERSGAHVFIDSILAAALPPERDPEPVVRFDAVIVHLYRAAEGRFRFME